MPNSIFKNKKAKYFILMVVLGMLIGEVAMLISIIETGSKLKSAGTIGLKQTLLFSSYQEAEKTLFYVDMSARWAAEEAFSKVALRGGFPDETACSSYLGFAVWDFEDPNCIPAGTIREMAFSDSMNEILDWYFNKAPELLIPLDNYDIKVTPLPDGKSLVAGTARIPLNFDVKKGIAGVEYSKYTSVNQQGPVGKTLQEKIKFVRDTYGGKIQKYVQQYGVPELESVIGAQIAHESGGRQYALGFSGEVGISQFIAGTAKMYMDIFEKVTPCGCIVKDGGSIDCKKFGTWTAELAAKAGLKCNPDNDGRFDPEKSINAQVKYMAGEYKYYVGKGYTQENAMHLALLSYNRGRGNVDEQIKSSGGFEKVNQPGGWWQVAQKNPKYPDYSKIIMASAQVYKDLALQVNDAPPAGKGP